MKVDLSVFAPVLEGIWSIVSARLLLPPVWRLTCLFFAPVLEGIWSIVSASLLLPPVWRLTCLFLPLFGWYLVYCISKLVVAASMKVDLSVFCPCLGGYLVYCISKLAVAASMKVDLSVFAPVLEGIWSIVSASLLLPPVWRLTRLFLPLSWRVFGLLYQQAGCCRQYEGWPVCFCPCLRGYLVYCISKLAVAASMKVDLSVFAPVLEGIWSIVSASLLLPPVWRLTCLFLPLSWRVFGLLYQQACCCRQYEGWHVCFCPCLGGYLVYCISKLAVAASMKVDLSVFAPVFEGIWSIVSARLLLPPVWRLTSPLSSAFQILISETWAPALP